MPFFHFSRNSRDSHLKPSLRQLVLSVLSLYLKPASTTYAKTTAVPVSENSTSPTKMRPTYVNTDTTGKLINISWAIALSNQGCEINHMHALLYQVKHPQSSYRWQFSFCKHFPTVLIITIIYIQLFYIKITVSVLLNI